MLKESQNPPIIWPQGSNVDELEGSWWVVHTKSRNEKALAWEMTNLGLSYFLPLQKKVTKKRGRVFRSKLPLFSGYVFFCGKDDDKTTLLRTHRVANFIEVPNQQQLIDELKPIQKAIENNLDLSSDSGIKKGQPCRVIAGALQGTEGKVVEVNGTTRLTLEVKILGQSTCLEIDNDLLEIIEESVSV